MGSKTSKQIILPNSNHYSLSYPVICVTRSYNFSTGFQHQSSKRKKDVLEEIGEGIDKSRTSYSRISEFRRDNLVPLKKTPKMKALISRRATVVCMITFQSIIIALYAIFCNYHDSVGPAHNDSRPSANQEQDDRVTTLYPIFQDVNVMIFIGFGYLMTFLRRYGFGAVGFTFLIASLIIEWGILCQGLFRLKHTGGYIPLNVMSMVNGDIIAAVVLISFGAVIGKTSPLQLLIMGVVETVLFAGNEYIASEILLVADAGGSIVVHVFGAYFGLAVSFALSRKKVSDVSGENLEGSNYQSDLTAMIGTIFLWMFWPSFNAALLDGNDRHRAIINTYLALVACCVSAFATSSLTDKDCKFDMVHIQNATLAGGVCVGSVANMMIQPYGALLIGCFAGILSTVGYSFIQGFLLKRLKLHDTCGVNNLHGMPGLASGLISCLIAGMATKEHYDASLYTVFSAMGPDVGRTPYEQAANQLFGLLITLTLSIIGGLFTGTAMKNVGNINELYNDAVFWKLPEEEEKEEKETKVEAVEIRKDVGESRTSFKS